MRGEYLFVRRSKRGPRLPKWARFCELADPGKGCPWALYLCDPPKRRTPFVAPISDGLKALLWSAEVYPPAMAFARIDVARRFGGKRATREEFARFYQRRLRHHLRGQPEAQHILAESVTDDTGYRRRGEFCWVLFQRSRFGDVPWVSTGGYYVYSAHFSDFKLPREWLSRFKRLPVPRPLVGKVASRARRSDPRAHR